MLQASEVPDALDFYNDHSDKQLHAFITMQESKFHGKRSAHSALGMVYKEKGEELWKDESGCFSSFINLLAHN